MENNQENIFRILSNGLKIKVSKRLSAILICLFIAVVCWFLIALSNEYNASLTFPVVYNNLPCQKVVVNDLPDKIQLHVKASGFKILSYNFSKERTPVQIDVDERIGQSFNKGDEMLVIPTTTFLADFNEQLGTGVSIKSFYPDSIVFNFSYKSNKRVPVIADFKINFDKQYDSIGNPVLIPDSVDVSGPASIIAGTNYVSTIPVDLQAVREPVVKNLKLLVNNHLTVSDTTIRLKIQVEKFTEETIEIPIVPVHVPKGFVLKTFPDKVNVRYQVSLSKYSQVTVSLFGAIADAGKMNEQQASKLNVELITSPSFVRSVAIEPVRVDYILRKQ